VENFGDCLLKTERFGGEKKEAQVWAKKREILCIVNKNNKNSYPP
jgi:hypothetical protein